MTPDEQARVDRMVFARDRRRCLAGWASRRLLLARCLGVAPASLRFEEEPQGRPFLVGRPLEFNLSHSQGQAAVAVIAAGQGPLLFGVDIESIVRPVEFEPLSERFFHPLEVEYLRRQSFSSQAFFRIWTGKESYLKALGTGLRRALDSFNVVSPAGEWRLCEPPGQPLPGWSMHAFHHPTDPAFLGCLTVGPLGGEMTIRRKSS